MDWDNAGFVVAVIVFIVVPCLAGIALVLYGLSIMSLAHVLGGAAILIADMIAIGLTRTS